MLLLLSIFRTKPLDQAFSADKYRDFLSKPYKDVLLNEIDANVRSYKKNVSVTEKGNKRYTIGVNLITIALLISIVLLLVNQFIKIEKAPTKVQVVNINKLP